MGSFLSQLFGDQRDSPERETDQQSREESQEQEATQDNGYTLTIEDKRIKGNSVEIRYRGPLTLQQLQQDATQPDRLFLVRFPNMSDQQAFLDTAAKTMNFAPVPASRDLSASCQKVSYLSVTKASLYGGRLLTFEHYQQPADVPLWSAGASPQDNTMLSFAITDDDTLWYQDPIQANVLKKVVGVADQTFAVHVFYVTNRTAKDIPLDIYIQPRNEGGSDNEVMEKSHSKEGESLAIKDTLQQSKEGPQEQEAAIDKSNEMTILDNMINGKRLFVQFAGPLTVQQLQQDATRPGQLFLVRFPYSKNQQAFLDTVNGTLSFRTVLAYDDLSAMMILKAVRHRPRETPKYTWSNVVIQELYLRVTEATPFGRGKKGLTFELTEKAQLWSVKASPEDEIMLSFMSEDKGKPWYLEPFQFKGNRKVVVGEDQTFNAHVFHITNHTVKDINSHIRSSEESGNNESCLK